MGMNAFDNDNEETNLSAQYHEDDNSTCHQRLLVDLVDANLLPLNAVIMS